MAKLEADIAALDVELSQKKEEQAQLVLSQSAKPAEHLASSLLAQTGIDLEGLPDQFAEQWKATQGSLSLHRRGPDKASQGQRGCDRSQQRHPGRQPHNT